MSERANNGAVPTRNAVQEPSCGTRTARGGSGTAPPDHALVKLDAARRALAEAKTIEQTLDVRDIFKAIQSAASRRDGKSAIAFEAAVGVLDSERQVGGMLAQLPRSKGGRPAGNSSHDGTSLQDTGIPHNTAHRWQQAHAVPKPTYTQYIEDAGGHHEKVTTAGLLRAAERKKPRKPPRIPEGLYRVIYADPPWAYGDSRAGLSHLGYGGAEQHYPTMSVEELCAMPVAEHIPGEAALFLWVPSPLLPECWPVIEAWGFGYKASFVWDKVQHNFGHYNSVRHELLLLCTHGRCLPVGKPLIDSVQTIERSGRHSAKPEAFREIITTLYPEGPYLELFHRGPIPEGWDVHGDEVPD